MTKLIPVENIHPMDVTPYFTFLKKDLKNIFTILYTFIIGKLNYLILAEHAELLENIEERINNLELKDFIETIDKLNLSPHDITHHSFILILLNVLNLDISHNVLNLDVLPLDISHNMLKLENQRGGVADYYGCIIPDLTDDSLKKMKTRDRARICKKNHGFPKNKYQSLGTCTEAIYQNPSLCHPPMSQSSIYLHKKIYQHLPYDIFPYHNYQEVKNNFTQYYQSLTPFIRGNIIIQFLNFFFKQPRFTLILITLIFLFSLVFFNLILPIRNREHLRRNEIERERRDREKRERRKKRDKEDRERRSRDALHRLIRFKMKRTIKKVIYYLGFINYTRIITHSKIREKLQLENRNLLGVQVLVLGKINRIGTIIGKTSPSKFKSTTKDIVQFKDGTQMKIFLGRTRKRRSYLKTKIGEDFRFIYQTLIR